MAEVREKCAVVGVSYEEDGSTASHLAYQALFALQHRGVEGSGISTLGPSHEQRWVRKPGMVRDVYQRDDLEWLHGTTAVGHNRYSTNGGRSAHLQPVTSPDIGYALAHNGNFPDLTRVEAYLENRRLITKGLNDSEMFAAAVASKIRRGLDIDKAVQEVQGFAVGAYACVAAYRESLFAFRDPDGIRPLEIGKIDGGIIFASETCALDTIGAEHVRSVDPGELVLAEGGKIVQSYQLQSPEPHFDIFELVYFARHDSVQVGERVNEVRRRFGYALAELHPPRTDLANTVVIPVPDTSVPAAEGYAEKTGIPHESAIVKNRYVGRTFMQPGQETRKRDLSRKHTIIAERVRGRDVILVDDSIVRGNTIPRLVAECWEAGARSVTVLIASPPVRFSDHYGIDTPSQDELLAANMTPEQMREFIGASYLGFLTVDAMVAATGKPAERFNLAPFTGEYPVSIGAHAANIRTPVSMEYVDSDPTT